MSVYFPVDMASRQIRANVTYVIGWRSQLLIAEAVKTNWGGY